MNKLEELTLVSTDRRNKIVEYDRAHQRWSTWHHWAINQPWYNMWSINNAFGPKDLKAKTYYPDTKVILEEQEGAMLWHHRHLAYHEKDQAALKESEILKELWFHTTNGFFTYSLEEIAEAYGRTPGFTHRHLYELDWFIPRRELEGKTKYKARE